MSRQYDSIMEGLGELLAYAKGDKSKGRSRIREAPPKIAPVKNYSKDSIKQLRVSLNLSQRSFADVLGVSHRTVESWENGANQPAGSSSRIIELLEKDHHLLEHYNVLARP
jgi:putative transcriptional regulator